MDIRSFNREAWDRRAQSGNRWTLPVPPDVIARARDWFPPMTGLELLGLACGGGQQGPIFAAAGAYDKHKVYDSLNAHSPEVAILIPPQKNACIWQHCNTKYQRLKRDENLRSIRKQGR